jgi:ribonuclease BN (tRNA processing enzyme)
VKELFLEKIKPPMFPIPLEQFAASLVFHEVGDDDFTVGNMQVRSRYVPHVGPTLGFRVSHAGTTVTYLSDHQQPAGDEFSLADGARDLCEEADLLIHDAQFTAAEFEQKASWGHSTYAYAQWVAETCRVKRLALFHHDPSRTDASLDMIAKDVAAAASVDVFAAREGETVDVVTCTA